MISRRSRDRFIKGFIWFFKAALCIGILFLLTNFLCINGLKPYYSYSDYNYQNSFSEGTETSLDSVSKIEQSFLSKGNILDSVSVYLGSLSDEEIDVSICHDNGKVISSCRITAAGYSENSWNKIQGLSIDQLEKGKEYRLCFSCDKGLSCLVTTNENIPVVFGECIADSTPIKGQLAAGFQFTYKYLTLGSCLELFVRAMISILLGIAMCFVIIKFEAVSGTFRNGNREGFLSALYFSVFTTLLYNPLETVRNEVSTFNRVIGKSLTANIDIAKRTSSFSRWFIIFAFTFAAFYLAANYFFKKAETEESKKVAAFLKNYMVLADCCLLLRIITFFDDRSSGTTAVFYFTSYAVMLVALTAVCYLAAGIDRRVSLKNYALMHFIGASISLPVSVIIGAEWGNGRVFLGIWFLISVLIVIYCRFLSDKTRDQHIEKPLSSLSLAASFIPLLTSLYIELIHVMNQHNIFISHPAKYYKIAAALFALVSIGVVVGLKKRQNVPEDLCRWSAPVFLFGIACLSIQIPISSTYNPDLFEGANYSILISDFLNHGTIPIVQHYGGHMMESVWEGILYGIINGDHYGALVSPYSSLIVPFLVLLFYSLVKTIWDKNLAFFTALFFPFYYHFSYYGLGMLICVAAISYIQKNTWLRAALLWGACVWCALYRLDLGFAFIIALILSLVTYIVVSGNRKAAGQFSISLAAWGISGTLLWFILCAAKGVNPINRLKEFLFISLSNQNWAYIQIGNTANTVFGWTYIIIPFLAALGLIYTTFSGTMRKRIGTGTWIVLLVMGWSYFENFSRGLVRHSLAETDPAIITWSGYLFLAMFISAYRNNKKLFLPAFMALILCNTLFVQDENFTSASIAEEAMTKPFSIVESWRPDRLSEEDYYESKLFQDRYKEKDGAIGEGKLLPERPMTYWEQVHDKGQKADRVVLDPDLVKYTEKYAEVINVLLGNDETFVDFMNKTLLYSLLEKENPVYVSQSPLQLSGEFTQEEFIREIDGIPLVIMPVDAENYRLSSALDRIANAYRYYKISEYIYQNYVPLCQYGNDYAIWCLKNRAEEFKEKAAPLVEGTDHITSLARSEGIRKSNVELAQRDDGSVEIAVTGNNPKITELQNMIDITGYIGSDMSILIDYSTDTAGPMKVFYTTKKGERYDKNKVVTEDISGSGTVFFTIPITRYSRIRLATPEGSSVVLKSLITAKSPVRLIDYGYDGPNRDGQSYTYTAHLHKYILNQLPGIWAESDRKKAAENPVIVDAVFNNGVYTFDPDKIDKSKGNYCLFSFAYDGLDIDGLYEDDDEQVDATIIFGNQSDTGFEEKCSYILSLKEGTHNYLIRCSTDYYWYLNQLNAIKIVTDGQVYNVSASILEGD